MWKSASCTGAEAAAAPQLRLQLARWYVVAGRLQTHSHHAECKVHCCEPHSTRHSSCGRCLALRRKVCRFGAQQVDSSHGSRLALQRYVQ